MLFDQPEFRVLDNGNLLMTLGDEGRAELADMIESGKDYWSIMGEMFESTACNGSYAAFDAGDGNPFVGLTSAPCIAESMIYEDDGQAVIDGAFWYSEDYMLVNELESLRDDGQFIWTLASESTS